MAATTASSASSAFIWRRVHSLAGLWLILYLIEHLIVNSQAALWVGDDGSGFVKLVNLIESLPFLQAIEIAFIGMPFAIHIVWGVQRAWTARNNSNSSDGSRPSLPYKRNRAFSWQRWTSWILLVGVVGHVVQMRFLHYPKEAMLEGQRRYLTAVTFDEGLYTVAARVGVALFTKEQIAELAQQAPDAARLPRLSLEEGVRPAEYDPEKERSIEQIERNREMRGWLKTASSFRLSENQVVVSAPTPGKAMLLKVRDTFKSWWMIGFYSVFVIAAAFHAFNGFWTSLLTWGAILSYRSQKAMLPAVWFGTALLSVLGLAAIWGSYWLNLRT